ncbi:hypothetical protein ASZ90_010522 [hydrocarbon metagenome]|uniref:Uncharacterized protein n=1 Tax=hydrocarbon metagenome TaxID=938273 RepID=A0A0W8FFU7_9ZZZZ
MEAKPSSKDSGTLPVIVLSPHGMPFARRYAHSAHESHIAGSTHSY